MNIGCLIYTYDRTDDALILMEIVREQWSKFFPKVYITHCFNGRKSWYPKKYLEDKLIRQTNPGHFAGASNLIDAGMTHFMQVGKKENIESVVVLAADTWLLKPDYLYRLLENMRRMEKVLATTPWGMPGDDLKNKGFAGDFFVINLDWAKRNRFFPINYQKFYDQYIDLIRYQGKANILYEDLLKANFIKAATYDYAGRSDVGLGQYILAKILLIKERMPVHYKIDQKGFWLRQHEWPKIGLYTNHEPTGKQRILQKMKLEFMGSNSKKLIESKDLSYFNIHNSRKDEKE